MQLQTLSRPAEMITLIRDRVSTETSNDFLALDKDYVDDTVSNLRECVAELIGYPTNLILLYYRGIRLIDGKPLREYNYKSGHCILAVRERKDPEISPVDKNDPELLDSLKQLRKNMHLLSAAPRYRFNMETIFRKLVFNLRDMFPGLATDYDTLGILCDPDIMYRITSKKDCAERDKLLQAYPRIGKVILVMASALTFDAASHILEKMEDKIVKPPYFMGLFARPLPWEVHDSDEEAEEDYGDNQDPMQSFEDYMGMDATGAAAARDIPQSLAQYAISPYGGVVGQQQSTSGNASAVPSTSSSGGRITAQDLASALAQAVGPSTTSAPAAPPPVNPQYVASALAQAMESSPAVTAAAPLQASPAQSATAAATRKVWQQVMEVGLAKLRDMGITDEDMAKRALIAANGDVEAAIQIIFSQQ